MSYDRPAVGRKRPISSEVRGSALLAPGQKRLAALEVYRHDPEGDPSGWTAALAWDGRGLPAPGIAREARCRLRVRGRTRESAVLNARSLAEELGIEVAREA